MLGGYALLGCARLPEHRTQPTRPGCCGPAAPPGARIAALARRPPRPCSSRCPPPSARRRSPARSPPCFAGHGGPLARLGLRLDLPAAGRPVVWLVAAGVALGCARGGDRPRGDGGGGPVRERRRARARLRRVWPLSRKPRGKPAHRRPGPC
ncbi:hypothetical protein LT493_02885 [Streptomyces tricolor]|nr:hypothetical protein [Streptomyces tricolor]